MEKRQLLNTTTVCLLDLPDELLVLIGTFLRDEMAVCQFARVNRRLLFVCENRQIWREVCKYKYGCCRLSKEPVRPVASWKEHVRQIRQFRTLFPTVNFVGGTSIVSLMTHGVEEQLPKHQSNVVKGMLIPRNGIEASGSLCALLHHGVTCQDADYRGWTALHLCAEENSTGAVSTLLGARMLRF